MIDQFKGRPDQNADDSKACSNKRNRHWDHLCEQGYGGRLLDKNRALLEVSLVDTKKIISAEEAATAGNLIEALYEGTEKIHTGDNRFFPDLPPFLRDYRLMMRDRAQQSGLSYMGFQAKVNFNDDNLLRRGLSLKIMKDTMFSPVYHSFASYGEQVPEEQQEAKDLKKMCLMAEKFSNVPGMVKIYERMVQQKKMNVTLGGFISMAFSVVIRNATAQYADKHSIAMMSERSNLHNTKVEFGLIKNQSRMATEAQPFMADLRSPASLINKLNIISHFETDKALYDATDIQDISDYLNHQQDFYQPNYPKKVIHLFPETADVIVVPALPAKSVHPSKQSRMLPQMMVK